MYSYPRVDSNDAVKEELRLPSIGLKGNIKFDKKDLSIFTKPVTRTKKPTSIP